MPEVSTDSHRISVSDAKAFDIDRRYLLDIRKQFLEVNDQRLIRTRQALQDRQALILDLIPLLFHINHPLLPGFINRQVPAGLSGYKPDKDTQRNAKRLSRGFRYQPLEARQQAIESLFVMGSVGTIGQSPRSDLDIWVCHSSELTTNQLDLLRQKCEAITHWADTYNLEVCFFPMDSRKFIRGETLPLSEESSGNAQHGLLLDEFYRSAIYLGGRVPLWWFVPVEHEHVYERYSHELLYNRFLRETEVIDFGQPRIPASEYITAAIWQLYKGIHAPHKSVLKLLLLESYAAAHPATQLLSSEFKRRVYNGSTSINQLDPYLLTCEAIENYLQQESDKEKLDLVRRCLYFKIDKALTRPPRTSPPSWQRTELQSLVERWGWDQNYLHHLDARRRWRSRAVSQERQKLVRTLLLSYRQMSQFMRDSKSPLIQKEITLLGRKLHAAFDRKAGKIEWINPDISPDISEPYLTVRQKQRHSDQWTLLETTPGDQAQPLKKPLKSGYSPLELLVWAYCNEVWTDQTMAWLQNEGGQASKLSRLYNALRTWLPLPVATASHNCFNDRPFAVSLMLVLNLQGHSITLGPANSLDLDPLNLGRDAESLVNDSHIVVHNSWNEVFVHSFKSNSLEGLLTEFLKHTVSQPQQPAPQVTVMCSGSEWTLQLQKRIEQLVSHLLRVFRNPAQSPRFILFHQGVYSCWQVRNDKVHWQRLGDDEQLFRYLEQPQPQLSAICFDRHAILGHPLQAMSRLPASAAIQVGYRRKGEQAELFIIDERGSLFHFQTQFHSEAALLRPLHQFLRNVIQRQDLDGDGAGFVGVYPIEFYQLHREPNHTDFTAERRGVNRDITDLPFFNIQVIVEVDAYDHLHYAIYCNDMAFHEAEYGHQLFPMVAAHILAQRHNRGRYPCYITDLDLSACAHIVAGEDSLQTSHYLRIKADIEKCLNMALEEL